MWRQLTRWAGEPVDIASLALFRVAFGALVAWSVFRALAGGNIPRQYSEPLFAFSYPGFEWVPRLEAFGLATGGWLMGLAAIAMALGAWYRLATAVVLLGELYLFLHDASNYLNHAYLVILVATIMLCLPAHGALSVDAYRTPSLRLSRVPRWMPGLLALQMGIVYFYGGIAKLNGDWFQGYPLILWLGPKLEIANPWGWPSGATQAWFMSWVGLVFDLAVAPLLLWRRSRPHAFVAATIFHLVNARIFSIGIFPWFAITISTLFFAPDWPRRRLPWLPWDASEREVSSRQWVYPLLAAYLAVQLLLPLRHHLYPGNVAWNEEGHRFSWRMKLRGKEVDAIFFVKVRGIDAIPVRPGAFLKRWQRKGNLARPDHIVQFAHFLARHHTETLGEEVEWVRARVKASLHRRPFQLLVDEKVNLLEVSVPVLSPLPHVLPLDPAAKPGALLTSPSVSL